MMPSAKVSSSTVVMSLVTCCHLPRGSVNRKSTYFTSLSLIIFMTFLGVVMLCVPFRRAVWMPHRTGSFPLTARRRKQWDQQFRWRRARIPLS